MARFMPSVRGKCQVDPPSGLVPKMTVGEGEDTALCAINQIAAQHQAESSTGDRAFDAHR